MQHVWVLYLLGSLGATAFAIAVFQIVKTLVFLRSAERASGKVVRLDTGRSGRNRTLVYLPIVWFQTPDNQLIEVAARTAASPPDYNVGDTVRVKYLPHKASESARIESFWEIWYPVVVSLIVAAVFVSITLGIYLKGK